LGGRSWQRAKKKAKDAISEMVKEILDLYAAREAFKGMAFAQVDQSYREFEAIFEYEETPDQIRAIGTAVAVRMAGGADIGAAGREGIERQVPKRVGVIVTPQKAASWDHGKLR
jgi:hypothetical protein